jgi:hypothetical protein
MSPVVHNFKDVIFSSFNFRMKRVNQDNYIFTYLSSYVVFWHYFRTANHLSSSIKTIIRYFYEILKPSSYNQNALSRALKKFCQVVFFVQAFFS